MDVAIIQPFLEARGGAERVILEIARKYASPIYTLRYDKKTTFNEFAEFDIRIIPKTLHEIPAELVGRMDRDSRMREFAAAGARFLTLKLPEDFDVLNPHAMPSEWIANRNSKICWYCHSPSRAAYDMHDYLMAERKPYEKTIFAASQIGYRFVESRIVPKIETICVNSKNVAVRVEKYLKRDDAIVIPPGVTPRDFTCSGYEKFFFYPSRIVPEKRIEMAIDAFARFCRAGRRRNWKLVVAGHLNPIRRNLAYLSRLKEKTKGLPVEFVFDVPDQKMRKFYSNCFATVFCAILEDWGLVPLESMASSKPCISVNEGGPTESIVNGKTGFLVNSVEEMAERMKFLADHPEICERMGKAGRKRVEQNYTWKIFLDKMDKAFKETAKKSD